MTNAAPPIRLETLGDCQKEQERAVNGLAYLDHAFTEAVDLFDLAESEWENYEATAAAMCGEKGLTATELKGRITVWVTKNTEAAEAKARYRETKSHLRKIERYFRSLEHRASIAQSAQKRLLESPGNYGGSV